MPTFKNNVEKAYQSLIVLFQEAAKADEVFHAHLHEGTKKHGIAVYKNKAIYQTTLADFRRTHQVIEEIVRDVLVKLEQNDVAALATACAYLSVKQRHFRSGYTKGFIARKIKRFDLNEAHKDVLREIIVDQIGFAGPEFIEFIRWLPMIKNEDIVAKINAYEHHDKPHLKQRLEKILSHL